MSASARRIRQLLSWLGDRDRQLQLALDAAELGTWNWDPATNELVWSERCRSLLGVSADEPATVDNFLKLVHPDDRAAVGQAIETALQDRDSYSIEYRIVRPDGETRWLHSLGRVHQTEPQGRSVGMSGIVRDVTAAKLHLQAQLRRQDDQQRLDQVLALAHRLLRLRQAERLDLAGLLQRDILGELIALPAGEPSLAETIERLRRIVYELNPPGIEELGFAGALEHLLVDQAEQGGFEFELAVPEAHMLAPPKILAVIYSVAQEAVVNVARHARATRVHLVVTVGQDQLQLLVRDNGVGISEGAWPQPQCYGLLAASERLAELGGTLHTTGAPGQGTSVAATIPLTPPQPRPHIDEPLT